VVAEPIERCARYRVFTDAFTRIDGTDVFRHVVVGFDFNATLPGDGLVLAGGDLLPLRLGPERGAGQFGNLLPWRASGGWGS
jgi:hypothetical protein